MDEKYILVNREPVKVDLMTWAEWFQNREERRVALTETKHYSVSTVFLGIDHRFGDEGSPLLFETMSFDSAGEAVDEVRYSTYDEAIAGHEAMVRRYQSDE